MESSEPWFFACFYGLLGILILCLFLWTAQNPACLPAFMNFVPTLLRTLEPFSALLGILCLCMFLLTDWNPASLPAFMKSLKPWFFACFYWLLGTLCLCLFLWTARNPASLPAFMKSSEPWFISFHKFWCPRVMKIPIGWNLEKNSLGCFFINWLLEKFVKLSCEMWKSIRINL